MAEPILLQRTEGIPEMPQFILLESVSPESPAIANQVLSSDAPPHVHKLQ